ncbi:MAG: hypothetical protein HC905_28870 [Bacteroidales bacterium]|nr:hypothetical protein [Bacteroidales bacterium]
MHNNGDTLSTVYYYYNNDNQIDSVISDKSKTYHSYSSDNHSITKINSDNIKYYESITTYENGFTTKFEEYYYNEDSELYKSFIESKEYDGNKKLIKITLEQFDLYSNSSHYDEIRTSYDSFGRKARSDSYYANHNLLRYQEYIYDGDNLVKIQSYDSGGNKTGYTRIENTCIKNSLPAIR